MKKTLLTLSLLAIVAGFLQAQSPKCGTEAYWEAQLGQNPSLEAGRAEEDQLIREWLSDPRNSLRTHTVLTIPVVVHVVYNTPTENITDAQIFSQIAVLNADFRRLNADTLSSSHPFWPDVADVAVEFCLASRDPSGAATTGITRTSTTRTSFNTNDDVKRTTMGGRDNWDPTQYLNIWVCDLGGSLNGYASFPSGLSTAPGNDGVVINHRAFGTMGTVVYPYHLGRAATHEVAHWLNLIHLGSGPPCNDDGILDTPPIEGTTFGCATFPHHANNACGSGPNGEMFMNFMSYVDDSCMNLFTNGQKAVMQAVLNLQRQGLLTSQGCALPTSVGAPELEQVQFAYPNPSSGYMELSLPELNAQHASLSVVNALGAEVLRASIDAFPYRLDLRGLPSEIYFLRLQAGDRVLTQKVVLAR